MSLRDLFKSKKNKTTVNDDMIVNDNHLVVPDLLIDSMPKEKAEEIKKYNKKIIKYTESNNKR